MRWLKNALWKLECPWPSAHVEKVVRALNFSICGEERFAQCMELYELNEAHGVPTSHRTDYFDELHSGRMLTVLAEDAGQPVGTFGLQFSGRTDIAFLCYMLVSPAVHRTGVGTTMFFASLAMLPEAHRGITMCISALAGASGFYRRFGFQSHAKDRAPQGYLREFAVLPVSCFTSRRCRILLAGANVTLPTLPYTIPFVSETTNRTSPS